MKIKNITHHDISTKEFKKFTKVSNTFGDWRQVSKVVNFSTLFGATAPTLAVQLENSGYTSQDAKDYISNIKKEREFAAKLNSYRSKGFPLEKAYFQYAAEQMLEAYYTSYPGVKIRSKREADFANKHGYVRAWHGPVRHLPELLLMRKDKEGNLIGNDKKEYSALYSNRVNQASNSPIQSMEARIAIANIINLTNYLEEWGLKSHLYNMTHDSCDMYVYIPEIDLVSSLIEATSTWKREPLFGVYMKMDFEWCYPKAGHQYNIYHSGLENPFKVLPIVDAVKVWNEEHANVEGFKPISWHGCII